MKKNDLTSKIENFLAAPEADKDFISKYMSDLQQKMAVYSKTVGIAASGAGLLSVLFLLISARGVGRFTAFGVEITRYSAVSIAIPPIVALILVRMAAVINYGAVAVQVYKELSKKAYPVLFETGLWDLTVSDYMPFLETPSGIWKGSRLWVLLDKISNFIIAIVALAPYIFFIYAFYILFDTFHVEDFFVWFSLCATTLFSVLTTRILLSEIWEK